MRIILWFVDRNSHFHVDSYNRLDFSEKGINAFLRAGKGTNDRRADSGCDDKTPLIN